MALRWKWLMAVTVLTCVACCVYGRNLDGSGRQKRQTTTNLPTLIDQIVGEVSADAEVDFVMVADRSRAMGRSWFYRYEKTFAQALITQYVNMHPDYVRLAVVTFGKDVSSPIDYISTPSEDNLKIKLFYSMDPAWDDVLFFTDPEQADATDLNLGLSRAKTIFEHGRTQRPGVKQILLTASDGNYDNEDEDPLSVLALINQAGVKCYSVGLGSWLQTGNIREAATNVSYYAPYDDSDGTTLPGSYDTWMDLLTGVPRAGTADTFPLYYPIDELYCDPVCNATNAGLKCFTDTRSGHANCVCPAGKFFNTDTNTCEECEQHRYKSEPGNGRCDRCPSAYITENTGSTSINDCICHDAATDCNKTDLAIYDSCEPSPCNVGQQCFNMLAAPAVCSAEQCMPGFESLADDCQVNIDNCVDNLCTSNSQCLDMVDDYACVCPTGFYGRFCELNIDECMEGICDNNATCTDKINDFYCNCSDIPYDGLYCQNLITTTTTPPTTTPGPTTTTVPVVPEDEFPWPLVIGAALGGFLFIVIIIGLIICIVMHKRRRAAEKEAAVVKEELDTLKRERRGRQRQTFTKSISQAFQGFWKRRTLRSSMYENHADPAQGAPTAPPSRRPDLLAESEPVNIVDEFIMDDQGIKATNGMDGWKSYLMDLQRSRVIDSGMIADIDGGRYACTSKFTADQDEVERIDNDLHLAKKQTTMMVLDQEYLITERDDEGTQGIATDGSSASIMMSRTKKYLIVLLATVDTDKERNRLKKELQWITDHIKGEGY